MLDLVLPEDYVEYLRHYFSKQPTMILRELAIHLMTLITDLSPVPAVFWTPGSTSNALLNKAILNFLFGGDTFRPRKYF